MEMCMKHMGKMGAKEDGSGLMWFPLTPIIIGGVFFALGWYLDPEITRILWLVLSGIIVFIGVMMWIMGSMMFNAMEKK